MNNIFFSSGIVAYYKGSLSFSIMNKKLFLQGGAAYDSNGTLLLLPKTSYCLLDDIELFSFEDHQKYYFYLSSKEYSEILDSDLFIGYKELESEIFFFISLQKFEEDILLGEVTIDYDAGNKNGVSCMLAPYNQFSPSENEIDIINTKRHYILPSPVREKEREEMSNVFFNFSKKLYEKMVDINYIGLSVVSHSFFHFSSQLKELKLTPEEIYIKLKSNMKLFSWLDFSKFNKEEVEKLKDLETFFDDYKRYKASYYHMDINSEGSLFYHMLSKIKELTVVLERNENDKPYVENISESYISEDFDLEPFALKNVTVIEDSEEESLEESTVLLSTKKETYVQVGRGTQSGNDIILAENDKTVSRVHLRVSVHKKGFFLEDMSSMGTYVEGVRIEKKIKKFVTVKNKVVLGKKGCILDLSDYRIQALLAE